MCQLFVKQRDLVWYPGVFCRFQFRSAWFCPSVSSRLCQVWAALKGQDGAVGKVLPKARVDMLVAAFRGSNFCIIKARESA